MPDISMCINTNCEQRMKCFRYRAEPNPYRQSYAIFNLNKHPDECNSFWPIESTNGYELVDVEELQ